LDEGTKASCCSGARDGQYCDINYYPGSQVCNSFMQQFCSTGDRIATNSNCQNWCNQNKAACSAALGSICKGDMLRTAACQSWCTDNPNSCRPQIVDYCSTRITPGPSWCNSQLLKYGGADNQAQEFCRDHQDSDFCSCFKSIKQSGTTGNPTLDAVLARPECYVASCSSGLGYKTTNMRDSGGCPPVQVCQNTINTIDGKSVSMSNVVQNCEGEQDFNRNAAIKKKLSSSNPVDVLFGILGMPDFDDKIQYLLVLLFVVVVVVMGLGIAYAFGSFNVSGGQNLNWM
jgi:hypothetical protein